jgi:hypothetical protein
MALAPTASIGVGVAMVGIVYGIYDQVLPEVTDIRVQESGDRDLAAAEKTARWASAGMVTAVSLIAWDPTVFIIGASAVVVFSWMHRHANWVDPHQGAASSPSSRQLVHQAGNIAPGYTPAQ